MAIEKALLVVVDEKMKDWPGVQAKYSPPTVDAGMNMPKPRAVVGRVAPVRSPLVLSIVAQIATWLMIRTW
jgi:hypothetical protein